MNALEGKALIIGASGGIGQEIARQLAARGIHVVLVGRRRQALETLAEQLHNSGATASIISADLATDAQAIAHDTLAMVGAPDLLINCAGMQTFGFSQFESSNETSQLFSANIVGPIQLINALLPSMLLRKKGHIVNVGSIFGSIAYPCFASYSASKFALRGFSEALRRELHGSGIQVNYIAPRYTHTSFNHDAVAQMATALKMNQDQPEAVAAKIIAAIEQNRANSYLGWPEKLFVRINAILPGLVDSSLIKQVKQMSPFARMKPLRQG